jgi:pyruvate kinase
MSLRRTKIIATLGPATDRPGMLEAILREGVDVVRLNFSHGSADDQRRRIREVRSLAHGLGREVGVLADLRGPKIRINEFVEGRVELEPGQPFVLDCHYDAPPGDRQRVGVAYLNLRNDVKRGDTLLLDDGLISMRVDDIVGLEIRCTVIHGGTLSNRKGLNRLGGGLSVPALTDRDRADIELGAELGLDYLAVSFARAPADITETRALLRKAGSGAGVVAKIERAEAIAALGDIIDVSDAVMVARGDLGVEIGDAELPGLQKKIIREALARNRAVITATQMLQSMVDSPIPTRAEVLDVANAVIDGTDAVMLSEETAAGKFPDRAVAAMARICIGAERQFESTEDYAKLAPKLERTDQAIALASMFLASRVGVRAIVALTESGGTAQWLSRYRTTVPIYGLSRHQFARQRMALYRDVFPIHFDPHGGNPMLAAREAVLALFQQGKLAEGDRVILTTGDHTGELGGTNTLKLLKVVPGGVAEGLGDL